MTSKAIWVSISVLVVVGLLMGGFGCAKPAEEKPKTLTVGLSASMSGTAAPWGLAFERACSLSTKDINARGGVTVGGTKYLLEVKTYDHAYDPAKATEIVKRMVTVDKVAWIVTHGAAVTKPIIPYTEENKVILMQGATGTDIMVFMPEKYSFRILTMGVPMSPVLLWDWIAANRPDIKTVAQLKPDDASGRDDAKDTKQLVEKLGRKMIYEDFYKRGTTDFYPPLPKLLASKPDLIDLASSPTADKARIIKQARELGFTGAFLDATPNNPLLVDMAKEAVDGVLYADYIHPNSAIATPEEKAFYNRFVEAYGLPFDTILMGIINGIYPVAQAIERANSLDPDKVAQQLYTGTFDVLGRKAKLGGVSVFGEPARQFLTKVVIGELGKDGKPKYEKLAEFPAGF